MKVRKGQNWSKFANRSNFYSISMNGNLKNVGKFDKKSIIECKMKNI